MAHHMTHLTTRNYLDPDISLNPARLEALCHNCHNTEHFSAGGAVARGLQFTPDGDIEKERTI